MVIDPISGNAIAAAQAKLNSPMIGRTTTEYVITKKGIIVYNDHFNLRLWEIAAAALVGAAIYYTPSVLEAVWDFVPDVPSLSDVLKKGEGEIPSKIFFEPVVEKITKRESPIIPKDKPGLYWPWEEGYKWWWE